MLYTESLDRLIKELKKMPGIGQKSAQRLAFYLLQIPTPQARRLAQAIVDLKEKIRYCSECGNITEKDPCGICTDTQRDRGLICVVESPNDLLAIEKSRNYKGLYHVLMGTISPLENIGPDDIRIRELAERIKAKAPREIILATNPNMEGEATAMYINKLLQPLAVKVTRIARGLPVGSELEYADEVTLGKALEGRLKM